MTIFTKKKQSKGQTEQLLEIIKKIDSINVDDPEYLEEIKLDIQEGIPLSEKKLEYLRTMIKQLKNNVENVNQEELKNQNTSTNDKDSELKPKSKKKFKLFSKGKNSHSSKTENTSSLKDKNLSRHDENNKSEKKFSFFKKKTSSKSKNSKKNKENKFLTIFSKKPKKQKLESAMDANLDAEKEQNNEKKEQTESASGQIIEQQSGQTAILEIPSKNDKKTDSIESDSQESNIEKTLDELDVDDNDFQTKQELELHEIKKIINAIEEEKAALSDDVNNVKSNHNYKKFISRFDELQINLDTASSGLYSVQSIVYKRLKEIRKLKADLTSLKDEIEELHYTDKK